MTLMRRGVLLLLLYIIHCVSKRICRQKQGYKFIIIIIGVQESHKPSISIANELSQQQGIEVMMVSEGSLVENLFIDEFEAVQNEMEIEPDGKQASIGGQ